MVRIPRCTTAPPSSMPAASASSRTHAAVPLARSWTHCSRRSAASSTAARSPPTERRATAPACCCRSPRRCFRGRLRARHGLPPRRCRPGAPRSGLPRGGPRRARVAGGARRPGRARGEARASLPRIEQLLLAAPGLDADEAERRAFRARKRAERALASYVASLSFRTVTYKALCAADQLAAFYADLRDPARRGSLRRLPPALLDQHGAVVGARPAVPAALPQRRDQRDPGQRQLDATRARAGSARTTTPCSRPSSTRGGSDSAMLDNVLELLVRGGRDVRHCAGDARPGGVGGERRARPGGARLLPLPLRALRAVGRAGRARLHRRPRRRRGARPQRPASAPLRGRRRSRRLRVRGRRGRSARGARASRDGSGRARCSRRSRARTRGEPRAQAAARGARARTATGSRRGSSAARAARRSRRPRRT